MKKNLVTLLILLFGATRLAAGVYNEPSQAWIFTYATTSNHNHNGLHIAWSLDGQNWHAMGPEHSFLKSDFGRWGSQKRMIQPITYRHHDGLWHCFFQVDENLGVLAHATSADMLVWRPQSYHYPTHGQRQVQPGDILKAAQGKEAKDTAIIDGQLQTGTRHQVPWSVVQTLTDGLRMADYKHRLNSETLAQDDTRFAGLQPLEATLSIDPAQKKAISNKLIGIFFEDINYAADGGLYAEMIQNRDFEYSPADREGRDPNWHSRTAWTLSGQGATFGIDTVAPIHPNNAHYAVLNISEPGAALINQGWDSIYIRKGEACNLSLFARTPESRGGKMTVRLVTPTGEVCAQTTLNISSRNWKKHRATLTPNRTATNARLEILPQWAGTLNLDMISLFPQNTFKGRQNGLRADLAQTLADMQPQFVRFPGGCVAHGDGLNNMYRWKNTLGPLEARVPQRNLWGYHQTAGLGYYEYFLFCEDIGAEPLPVLPAGVPCQNSGVGGHGQQCGIPLHQMDEYIQEVLDLIEWANGDARKTTWGRRRAEAGHPKPFNLKYIGIGNEDLISDVFQERYTMIVEAVRRHYPDITIIGTVGPFCEGSDYEEGWKLATDLQLPMVDEHYYNPPGWYIHNQDFYDRYDRTKSHVYLGEYAAHVPGRHNNIETALAEALHLANVERNADVVELTSYAPLLAKEGHTQWSPDLIYFDNTQVKPTVGYYVQQLYGQNAGDEYLPAHLALSSHRPDVRKRVATSVVHHSPSGNHIIKMVNILPVPVKMNIDLAPLGIGEAEAEITVLTGHPDDRAARPTTQHTQVSGAMEHELPPYSFTVVRLK
ncbi:alpha-L-arabinofuranosidase [Bacteroides sp. OttesenSCG-928-J23]|nr:alpha-L-arabinofuranosidase [Bacteroides sp. OttesenSCG-928-N06]MDL2247326.1 alpha-L-arabinofuranosidase [Bacteroides sp. OttesenSCG-928-J23]